MAIENLYKEGVYVVLNDSISAHWAKDIRFTDVESALARAKKLSHKREEDYYVLQVIKAIDFNVKDNVNVADVKDVEDD